jgi:hypothetical protein
MMKLVCEVRESIVGLCTRNVGRGSTAAMISKSCRELVIELGFSWLEAFKLAVVVS